MNRQLETDIQEFAHFFPLSSDLAGARFMITGATGLIGSTCVRCLLALDKGISITIPVRNRAKASAIYDTDSPYLKIVECDLMEYCSSLEAEFDYIIHCASPTAGSYMNKHPVETFEMAVETTRLLLQYARKHHVKGMVYVSSLEYYGQNLDDRIITEDFQGYVDATSARSSYPMGKRAAEYLCFAYAKEYGIDTIESISMTIGVENSDGMLITEEKEITIPLNGVDGTKNASVKKQNDAEKTQVSEETTSKKAVEASEANDTASDQVDPDFKKMMDSYEAFFDEYVEFMQKYENSGDVLSMMDDYSDYLTKYADYMEKLYAVDTNNLSVADAAYYTEVSARIVKKLAEIGQ